MLQNEEGRLVERLGGGGDAEESKHSDQLKEFQ